MGEKEWAPSHVLDVFGDELARQILVLTSERPLSADELAEHLDVSPPTIYRRVNELIDHDLLKARQQLDEDGHHYKTFETALKQITFEIEDGGYNIDIQIRRSLVGKFETFWTDLEQSSPQGTANVTDQAARDATPDDPHHG
jgi:predicted ArsR family transcriptional regulator